MVRLQTFAKLAACLAICVAMAATVSGQYPGGGTMGGTGGTGSGSGSSGMPHYNYGNGKAIGIGVGAAAGAAVGIALWIHHRHKAQAEALLIGCTQPASKGVSLKSEGDGQTYALISGRKQLQAGERVEVEGVLKDDPSGGNAFRVRDVVSDFGACSRSVASKTHGTEPRELAAATK